MDFKRIPANPKSRCHNCNQYPTTGNAYFDPRNKRKNKAGHQVDSVICEACKNKATGELPPAATASGVAPANNTLPRGQQFLTVSEFQVAITKITVELENRVKMLELKVNK